MGSKVTQHAIKTPPTMRIMLHKDQEEKATITCAHPPSPAPPAAPIKIEYYRFGLHAHDGKNIPNEIFKTHKVQVCKGSDTPQWRQIFDGVCTNDDLNKLGTAEITPTIPPDPPPPPPPPTDPPTPPAPPPEIHYRVKDVQVDYDDKEQGPALLLKIIAQIKNLKRVLTVKQTVVDPQDFTIIE